MPVLFLRLSLWQFCVELQSYDVDVNDRSTALKYEWYISRVFFPAFSEVAIFPV
jgi:hypothetical protein